MIYTVDNKGIFDICVCLLYCCFKRRDCKTQKSRANLVQEDIMSRRPAKMLESEDVCRVLAHVDQHRNTLRNQVMVLLSFKAGLRACEIAGLEWQMILLSNGKIASAITVTKSIAKKGSGRTIPLNTMLRRKICRLHREMGNPMIGPVIRSERGRHMSARSVVNWFRSTYADLGSGLIRATK